MAKKAAAGGGDFLADITKEYGFEGTVLELGAAVVDGTAHADAKVRLPLPMMNRHGLIAGATGTGKTKTLQLLAEELSAQGVPVFVTDIKGDVSGMAAAGTASDRITSRSTEVGDDWQGTAFPVEFLTLGGGGSAGASIGAEVRATITSFGPTLLSKVLGLNETQESSLGLVFHYADSAGLAMLDLKDLRAVLTYLTSDEGKADLEGIGGLSSATAGVILRELITFADAGADHFFGEPEFDTKDLLRTDANGKGIISVMELQGLQDKPMLFSTFLMWLLADLFHDLPEVGDVDKPKLVFFFDEAHLLFNDASKAFLTAVTQTVRLIRSKGVGVFFVTQNPTDVPDDVLAQLGNRVQHALRAFTPDDAKALKATVSTYPKSSVYDLTEVLPSLGIGEAIVTVLNDNGVPTPVAWTRLRAPRSQMGQLDPAQQSALVAASPVAKEYAQEIDRESAYEKLQGKLAPAVPAPGAPAAQQPAPEEHPGHGKEVAEAAGAAGVVAGILKSSAFKSFARSAASAAGREITRSLFGTASKRRR
ncbi:MAG TPA: helicase HerA-like domain-containing protein [Mycobacteriales bacterium]|nr:helicase HerA-like domain-containing protein [Mycobacteriales bacterium]